MPKFLYVFIEADRLTLVGETAAILAELNALAVDSLKRKAYFDQVEKTFVSIKFNIDLTIA